MKIIHTIGRRKCSIARIYFKEGDGRIIINNRNKKKHIVKNLNYKIYFSHSTYINTILRPFFLTNSLKKFDVIVKISGGGVNSQLGAISLAISRALSKLEPNNRIILKNKGLLTRDARIVERKKFGRKKARKRFQFSKR